MNARTFTIQLKTRGNDHILDITDEIRRVVRESGVATGQLAAMVVGSTASLTTLEYEPGLVRHDTLGRGHGDSALQWNRGYHPGFFNRRPG